MLHVGTYQCSLLIWFKLFYYQSAGGRCSCSPNPCQKYCSKSCGINTSTHSKLLTKKSKKTVRLLSPTPPTLTQCFDLPCNWVSAWEIHFNIPVCDVNIMQEILNVKPHRSYNRVRCQKKDLQKPLTSTAIKVFKSKKDRYHWARSPFN